MQGGQTRHRAAVRKCSFIDTQKLPPKVTKKATMQKRLVLVKAKVVLHKNVGKGMEVAIYKARRGLKLLQSGDVFL